MFEGKKRKYIVGKVRDVTKTKGWFFGHFMDQELLQSDLVDIAWQEGKEVNTDANKHYHTGTVEINVMIAGSASFTLNGQPVTVSNGDFYIIWPETVIDKWQASKDAQFIVIRAPSIPNGGKVVQS
jgi:uncharacterized protein YjlB